MFQEKFLQNKIGRSERMFSFWPPVLFGLQDAINPCGLASFIIFITFLSVIAKTRKRLIGCGLVVILIAGAVKALFVLGGFDELLQETFVFDMIRWMYAGLAVIFIICGIGHFKDWLVYKKSQKIESFIFKIPSYLKESFSGSIKKQNTRIKNIFFIIGLFLLSAVIGFFMAIMESVLGHDYALFIDLFKQGHTKFSLILTLILFSASSWILMIVALVGMLWVFSSRKVQTVFLEWISLWKIILSAIYLSVGWGLLYSFFA